MFCFRCHCLANPALSERICRDQLILLLIASRQIMVAAINKLGFQQSLVGTFLGGVNKQLKRAIRS